MESFDAFRNNSGGVSENSMFSIKGSSMRYMYSHEMQQQLKDSLELLKMILGPDLLGVYLYGSSLVGGLQKYSDIDVFVVTIVLCK